MMNQSLLDFILDFNPEITNVNVIRAGQKIRVPTVRREWLIESSSEGIYELRIATFRTPDGGKRYEGDAALKGKHIKVFPRKVSTEETWYRVVAGDFATKEEALRTLDLLKAQGLLPLFGSGPSQ